MRPLPPALLPLQLWARTHLFKNFIIIFLFYFLLYSASPGSPAAQPGLSAVCSLQPGAGSGGTTGAGLVPALPGWAGGAALPRSRARGGSAAGLGRTKEGGDHRSTACPRHRPRSGQGSAASAGHGRGEAQGAEKWEVGERGRGGCVENRRAP